jgi:4-hydroxy-3-methylbut-2-en-1-yl diphosphate reductase
VRRGAGVETFGGVVGGLLIAAPLRLEAAIVKSGARGAAVCRTGMGEARLVAATRALRDHPAAVVMLGFCGGLEESSAPGDVVVAETLTGPDEWIESGFATRRATPIECPAAEALAGLLAGRGLKVRRGGIASVYRPAIDAERAELREKGAVAVDMESAFFARALGERLVGVVRVVVDTPTRELWNLPATVAGGLRAALVLRRAAAAVGGWTP